MFLCIFYNYWRYYQTKLIWFLSFKSTHILGHVTKNARRAGRACSYIGYVGYTEHVMLDMQSINQTQKNNYKVLFLSFCHLKCCKLYFRTLQLVLFKFYDIWVNYISFNLKRHFWFTYLSILLNLFFCLYEIGNKTLFQICLYCFTLLWNWNQISFRVASWSETVH